MLPSEYPEVQRYPNVKTLLAFQVDMQFSDLHELLRLPRPKQSFRAGCNLTAAGLLFNIVSGASVLFFESSVGALRNGRRGERFKNLLARYYPWSDYDALVGHEAATMLWKSARNPLSHALGVEKLRTNLEGLPGELDEVAFLKSDPGLTVAQLKRLLAAETMPTWFSRSSTISYEPPQYVLTIELLSWGVHRMLRSLFADEEQATAAESTARQLRFGRD